MNNDEIINQIKKIKEEVESQNIQLDPRKYRPYSGSDGLDFIEAFCSHCKYENFSGRIDTIYELQTKHTKETARLRKQIIKLKSKIKYKRVK